MAITINGSANTVAGVAAGGINDNVVDNGTMADDAIGVAELSATGTASSSTFLRGDNAWAAPGGGVDGITSSADATAIAIDSSENTTFSGTLKIDSDENALSALDTASNYHLVLQNTANDTGEAVGIRFGISDGGDGGAAIYHKREGSNSQGSLHFATKPDGGNMTERLWIKNDGGVLIDATGNSYGNKFVVGATNPNSTASGSGYGWGIHHSGAMYWNMHDENSYWNSANSGNNHYIQMRTKASGVGNIHIQQSSVAYNTSSDYRLKENINYTWDATSRLKQLKPARFNWIIDDTNTLVDGFIAHEVSSIVPEAVSGEKDAVEEDGSIRPQGIDQAKLVPLLVKTIQELEARITALEAG